MFWVDGIPATKGSWRVMRGKLLPDNPRERPWANAVAWVAKASGVRVVSGPVSVTIAAYYPRPKRPTHAYPARNDADKIARSCLDALKGIAWADDQQVVELRVTKAYASDKGPGAWIEITEAA
jgi:Holliday junction resolvase RusA-like endonuclease